MLTERTHKISGYRSNLRCCQLQLPRARAHTHQVSAKQQSSIKHGGVVGGVCNIALANSKVLAVLRVKDFRADVAEAHPFQRKVGHWVFPMRQPPANVRS